MWYITGGHKRNLASDIKIGEVLPHSNHSHQQKRVSKTITEKHLEAPRGKHQFLHSLWCRFAAYRRANVALGEPALGSVEFSEPPVLLALQNHDQVALREAEVALGLRRPRAQGLDLQGVDMKHLP